jgi:hypothetical protein
MGAGRSSPSFGSSLLLQWHGETAFYQVRENTLTDSLRYPLQPPSPRQLLRGAPWLGRSFLLGFSLVTAVAPPLLEKHLLSPEASQVRASGSTMPVVLLRSHVSFHGDNFHQLHSRLLKGVEDDFRRELVTLHFSMLRLVLQAMHSRLNTYLHAASEALKFVNVFISVLSLASLAQVSLVLFPSQHWLKYILRISLPMTAAGWILILAARLLLWWLGRRLKSSILLSNS